MHDSGKPSATRELLKKAASLAASRTFPAWIDASEYGGVQACAVPRIRDSLVLRVVAGRRQDQGRSLIDATGAH
jgi:uncharacterized membrane protein YidH (DUF202 family)